MTSYTRLPSVLFAATLVTTGLPLAHAVNPVFLKVTIHDLDADGDLPDDAALCLPAVNGLPVRGRDRSPAVEWSNAPAETRSFVLIMTDPDVPLDVTLLRGPRPIPVEAARARHSDQRPRAADGSDLRADRP
ncbi:MAG: hypothetical protein J0H20_07415, partial [Rhizobiales bacterium]|nr:hypothetical protein [Hyphomicrobiales bacterium]